MLICTFGCSWTHGQNTLSDTQGWPYYLAKNNPHIEVINYAHRGTCINYTIDNFIRAKERYGNSAKYVIQLTQPYRYTKFQHKKIKKLLWVDTTVKNYRRIPKSRWDVIDVYQGSVTENGLFDSGFFIKPLRDWKCFLKDAPSSYWINQHRAAYLLAAKEADYVYCHTSQKYECESLQNILGDKFDDFCADDGHHFNTDGLKWIAKHVKQKINI